MCEYNQGQVSKKKHSRISEATQLGFDSSPEVSAHAQIQYKSRAVSLSLALIHIHIPFQILNFTTSLHHGRPFDHLIP